MKNYPKKTIGELCNIIKGETGIASAIAGEYTLVTTGKDRKTSASYQFDTKAVCLPLISSSGHGKKSLNYVHYQEGKFALGTILAAIIPKNDDEISAAFLHQYLLFYKDSKIVPLMRGAANVSLAVKDVAKIEIPLPPINEQKDFIIIFNKLQEFKNKLVFEFNKQEKYVSQLKQAILQEAIAGQLTAEWRTQNPMQKGNPDTDAIALLAKIKAEEQQLITDGKLKKEKPLAEIAIDEIPFSIPDSWVWCRLGEICDLIGGFAYQSFSFQKEGTNQILRLGNIRPNMIVLNTKPVYIDALEAEKTDYFRVHQGDILITMTGTRGKKDYLYTVRVDTNPYCGKNIYINQRIGLVRVILWNSYFANLMFKHDNLMNVIFESSTGSANQANIGMAALKNWIIPLPPLAEQKAIVEKCDRLMNIIDQLEQQIKHRKQLAEDLMQTVLREAFE
jgi:type I restriction enzyme, S subunit